MVHPSHCLQALVQQRAVAQMDCAAAKASGEAEAAARWQARVSDLRKQVGAARLARLGWRFPADSGSKRPRREGAVPRTHKLAVPWLPQPHPTTRARIFLCNRPLPWPAPQLSDARRRLQRSQEAEAAAAAQLQEARSQLACDQMLLCEAQQALSADQTVLRQASEELAAELVMLVSAVLAVLRPAVWCCACFDPAG